MTPEIEALMRRPSMQGATGRAGNLAQEQGQTLSIRPGTPAQPSALLDANGNPISMIPATTGTMTGRDAHLIKMGLDDMANSSAVSGIGGNELGAIRNTRGDFLNQVEQQIPSYGQARQTYAQMSRPVTQADVLNEVLNSGTNFRGNITPAAFANQLRNGDAVAQRITGQANATLGGVLEPSQMGTLNAVRDDLLRADFANTAGKGVGSDTVQKLAYSNLMNQSGLPALATSLGSRIGLGGLSQKLGQVVYRDANEEMKAKLAQALLNPQDAAALMEAGVVSPGLQALLQNSRAVGGAAGAATPALLNSIRSGSD